MSARERIALLLTALVLAACAGYAARIAGHVGVRAEWRRAKIAAVTPETAARLAGLEDDVLLSYFVTPARDMPAHLARVEEGVVLVLEALKRASAGKVDYQVVHPEDDPELAGWLDAVGVAPFRTRRVERDGYVEEEVWSTLQIAYGARPTAMVRAIAEEHLPRLQSLVLARLEQLESPRAPVVALDVPGGEGPGGAGGAESFGKLAALLRARADVRVVDFDADATLPEDADLFFWIEPRVATPAHLAALRSFTERGRSVVVAGGSLRLEPAGARPDGSAAWRAVPTGFPAETLLGSIGMRPLDGFALDAYCAAPLLDDAEAPVLEPFRIRCIAPDQDFRGMRGQPNGSLLFDVPTVFEPDGARLTELGLRATVLATTSNRSWLADVPGGPFTADDFPLVAEDLGAKRALAALVESDDPTRGAFACLAASTPLADAQLDREGFAHRALVRVLLATLASDERLALARTTLVRAAPLARMDRGERVLWRAVTCGLAPLLFAAALAARGLRQRRRGAPRGAERVPARVALLFTGAALVAGALAALAPRAGLDLSRDGRNSLAPETVAVAREPGPDVALELVFSPAGRLPPELRPLVRRARDLAAQLARAGRGIEVRSVDPDGADLAALGVEPFQVTSTFDEVTTVRTIVSAVRVVVAGEDRPPDVLPFESAASFEDVEFRLARALARARAPDPEKARVHVAVACDVPRLSPAEAMIEYTKVGLFAPTEGDVYGAARAALALDDFRVTFVDPTAPVLPAGTDVLVWLQPRRGIAPMLTVAAEFLARGGKLVVAAQHFDVVPRKSGESGTAFWPQPQFPDVDRHYFGPLGVELVREVLCDELSAPLEAEGGDAEAPPSPFQIRAVLEQAAGADPTRGLGDLLFPSGNRLRLDPERLAAHGLRARPLVFTSDRAWSYDWQGGVLPAAVLRGRAATPPGSDDPRQFLGERAPLVALVEGRFPAFDPEAEDAELALVPREGGAEGELLFIGSSKMFRGEYLATREFRHDHFLVNAVTALALGEEYLAILARRPVSVGLGYVAPEERLAWRTVVIGAAPALLVLAGAAFRLLSGARRSRARSLP